MSGKGKVLPEHVKQNRPKDCEVFPTLVVLPERRRLSQAKKKKRNAGCEFSFIS
jgi:hypothetical protein